MTTVIKKNNNKRKRRKKARKKNAYPTGLEPRTFPPTITALPQGHEGSHTLTLQKALI